MRHDWIIDVLKDLRRYAQANNLPAVAEQARIALDVARAEIAASPGDPGDDTPTDNGRPH